MSTSEVIAFDAPVDSGIHYPCYKPFDDLIDVERLKALDNYIREGIERHIADDSGTYFQNDHRLDAQSPYEPGVRELWLSQNRAAFGYD
jgi:hypothetical protein